MAYRYRCILAHEHHSCRFSYYKASSDDYCIFAFAVNSVIIKNLHACLRSTRRESKGFALKHACQRKICLLYTSKLSKEKDAIQTELEELYEKWEELSE